MVMLSSLSLLLAAVQAAAAPAPSVPPAGPETHPAPSEIVAAAAASDWRMIAPADLLVMDLAPDAKGRPRRVVIHLLPAPFSAPWVGNIRKLTAARWFDGIAVVRSQDNYVVQWGDPDGETEGKAKPLPAGLSPTSESDYVLEAKVRSYVVAGHVEYDREPEIVSLRQADRGLEHDPYTRVGGHVGFVDSFPMASAGYGGEEIWPVHCYGSVGVGRGMSPDAGTGAELYAVIGHAPRHLDRNIAVVGRVIEGIEHLSTLPRGTGPLGFYETPEERVAVQSVRMGNEVAGLPGYQYLSPNTDTFTRYAAARSNRRDPFFIVPAGGADICNVPVPVRRTP